MQGKGGNEQRPQDKRGHAKADHGQRHWDMVPGAVLFERGRHARHQPQRERDDQGLAAEFQRHRKGVRNNLVDSSAGIFEGRAEIALQQMFHLQQVLLEQRFVQPVVRFHPRPDFGRDLLFRVKRAAGRQSHHEKCGRGDDEKDRDRLKKRRAMKRNMVSGPPARGRWI